MILRKLNMREGYTFPLCEIWLFKCCFTLVFYIAIIFPAAALAETKTLTIDGLYVEVFPYEELSDYYNQKIRMAEFKRSKFYFDFSSYETFIPLSGCLLTEIPESRFRFRKENEAMIVKFSQPFSKNAYESAGFTTNYYATNEFIARTAINFATTYYESKSGKYIYRIVYMRVEVENSDADYEIKSSIFNLKSADNLWIVKRIISYDPYINIPWLKKWAPFKQYK